MKKIIVIDSIKIVDSAVELGEDGKLHFIADCEVLQFHEVEDEGKPTGQDNKIIILGIAP